MPGSTPPTSQLDWLISTTAMIVLSWSRATRDLLKSFGWGIRALHQLDAATMVPSPRRLPHTISPLEGGVSCELISEMPNSLLAGKIQGISSIRSLPAPLRPRKRARNQSLMGQFPTHPNREFLAALQGIKSGDQGSFRRDQGIRFRPLFGLPPDDKSDRSKSRKPDLELDAGFCPCDRRARHAEIARRARRRERSAFRASRWRHRSRRA